MTHVTQAALTESLDLPQDLVLLRERISALVPEIREQLAPAMARVVESTQVLADSGYGPRLRSDSSGST